jgi:hypothetical protein
VVDLWRSATAAAAERSASVAKVEEDGLDDGPSDGFLVFGDIAVGLGAVRRQDEVV